MAAVPPPNRADPALRVWKDWFNRIKKFLDSVTISLTNLESRLTLKVTSGGAIAGIGLAATTNDSGNSTSAVIVQADKFAIVSSDYAGGLDTTPDLNSVPFGVDADGVVYINGQVRINSGGSTLEELNSLSLTSDGFAFVYDSPLATTSDSPTITFTANLQNAVGTATFTAEAFGLPVSADDYYSNVTMLLQADGTHGSTTIVDTSPAPHTMTAYGNTSLSTTQYKYGTASLYFDGTGDYLRAASSTDFDFGTGDFTIETWIYPESFGYVGAPANTSDQCIVSRFTSWAGSVGFYLGTRSGSPNILIFRAGNSLPIVLNGNTALSTNTWYHIAISRVSGVTRMFVNGTQQTATHTGSVDITSTSTLSIGANPVANDETFRGYIDDFRITKGVGRYTGNFTPPTSGFIAAQSSVDGSLGNITLGGSGNTRTLTSTQFNSLGATSTRYVTVTATLGDLSDTKTVYRGDDGSDTVGMTLSNETHLVPADSSGTVSSWTGASTDVIVWLGITNDTSLWTFSKTDSNITTTLSGEGTSTVTVTATAMSADTGTCTITATRTGYPTQTKTFTVTKAKAGAAGARGSLTGYGSNYSISVAAWSDAKANRVIDNMLNGTTGSTDLATTDHLRVGDTITLDNGTSFSATKYWSGTAWLAPGVVLDGNLIVSGTVTAGAISVTDLATISQALGSVSSGNVGGTITIDTTGDVDLGGAFMATMSSLAGDPTATEIPASQWAVYKNTTSGAVKLWVNDAGTLKSVTLT